jgi:hypothetical protein
VVVNQIQEENSLLQLASHCDNHRFFANFYTSNILFFLPMINFGFKVLKNTRRLSDFKGSVK